MKLQNAAVFLLFFMPIVAASAIDFTPIFSGVEEWANSVSLTLTGKVIFFQNLPACTDSDNGINPYVRGTGTGYYSGGIASQNFVFGENPNSATSGSYRIDPSLNGSSIYYDHCYNSETHKQLNEGFCNSDGKLSASGYQCEYGCKDGVCIQCTGNTCNPSNTAQACINNTWVTCSEGYACSNGACIQKLCTTGCNPSNNTQYCSNGQWSNCPGGNVCSSGTCMPECKPNGWCNPVNASQICNNGLFEPCSGNQLCSEGTCKTPVCSGNGCNPNNASQVCANGQWIGCRANTICRDAACWPLPFPNETNASNQTPTVTNTAPVLQVNQTQCLPSTCNLFNNRQNCVAGQWMNCPNGQTCSAGQCIAFPLATTPVKEESEETQQETGEESTTPTQPGEQTPATSVKGTPEVKCKGCVVEEQCVNIGLRYKGTYCAIQREFEVQRKIGELCENNFECTTNLCFTGKCSTVLNIVEQIIMLLRRLFGFG